MNQELLFFPMVDVLDTYRAKEMSNFFEDEWLNPAATPYIPFGNPFENTAAVSLPHHPPFATQGLGYTHARSSSAGFLSNLEHFAYPPVAEGSIADASGLANDTSTAFAPPNSNVSPYSTPRHSFSKHNAYHESSTVSRGRSFTQPALPPTPAGTNLVPIPQSQNFHPIAPLPSAGQQSRQPMKRQYAESEHGDVGRSPQRQRSTSTTLSQGQGNLPVPTGVPKPPTELTEEEQMLFKLKQEENLPWKDISRKFEAHFGRVYHVPALQMRYKRLKERLRTWTPEDVDALELAHEYWQKAKFEIISQKMLEHGAQEKWPAKLCQQKWEQLHPELGVRSSANNLLQQPPALLPTNSNTSSDGWIPQDNSDGVFGGSPMASLRTRSPGPLPTPALSRSPLPRSPPEEKQP